MSRHFTSTRTVTYSSSNGPSRTYTTHSSSGGGIGGRSLGHYNRPESRPNFGSTRNWRPSSYGGSAGGNRYNALVTTDDKPTVNAGAKELRVTGQDYAIVDNRRVHKTQEYEDYSLIVRRGEDFKLSLNFNREVDLKSDKIELQFAIGTKPKKSKGSLIVAHATDALKPTEWGYKVKKCSGNQLDVSVQSAPDCIIGAYTVFVNLTFTDDAGKVQVRRHKIRDKVTILFNPWCANDQVFLDNDAERFEYVLNETGRVFVGTNKKIFGRPWNFGQFESCALEAALFLLEKSYLSTEGQGNPTRVVRALSALVNSSDGDNGVLEGNWSGNYSGGKPPTAWNGSVAILDEYLLTKRPVKFGQCWVFSGLTTTLCRALGIPTRSVTNFQSAHDSDCSMTIDEHVSEDGRPISEYSESIWNFHVWNEAFFSRPDLPDGNDGWQAFDATPQETSEGMFRCGPAPVNAIKEGNVFYNYDAPFIYAEVNGDYIVWMVDSSGAIHPVNAIKNSVGSFISTKAVGQPDRMDITHIYKYAEGSQEEAASTQKAWKYSTRKSELAEIMNDLDNKDMKFKLEGDVHANGDLCIKLNIENKSGSTRTVNVKMYANAKYYTGVPGEEIDEFKNEVTVDANSTRDIVWDLGVCDYLNRLDEDAMLGIYAMAKCLETGQSFSAQDKFDVDKPDINMEVKGTPQKGREFEVQVQFTNPLATRLTGCRLFLEGPGIQKELNVPIKKVINAGETVTETVKLKPRMAGKREVIANLHSQQVTGITGALALEIRE